MVTTNLTQLAAVFKIVELLLSILNLCLWRWGNAVVSLVAYQSVGLLDVTLGGYCLYCFIALISYVAGHGASSTFQDHMFLAMAVILHVASGIVGFAAGDYSNINHGGQSIAMGFFCFVAAVIYGVDLFFAVRRQMHEGSSDSWRNYPAWFASYNSGGRATVTSMSQTVRPATGTDQPAVVFSVDATTWPASFRQEQQQQQQNRP